MSVLAGEGEKSLLDAASCSDIRRFISVMLLRPKMTIFQICRISYRSARSPAQSLPKVMTSRELTKWLSISRIAESLITDVSVEALIFSQ